MPIYMDVHIVPGVTGVNVAEAHRLDLAQMRDFGCNCMTYWVDESRETVFCLIEAPTKEAVEEMHRQAHGLLPNKIIEVSSNVVESFLGRIYDPEEAEVNASGLKVFADPSFRVLLVTKTTDPVILKHQLGQERASELLRQHHTIIRKNIIDSGGREVENAGSGFIISFASAAKALHCALAILSDLPKNDADSIGFRMSLNGGEPVENSSKLFGDTIQRARQLCSVTKYHQVALSSSVKELLEKDQLTNVSPEVFTLPKQDEMTLQTIFETLEKNWTNPSFDVDEFCRITAMSKSQLYRKTVTLTGMSPNDLIKEYRLEKAKDLMKQQYYNISQVCFDSGFTSPSYFTKCFKKKYGLLPMNYVELLQ